MFIRLLIGLLVLGLAPLLRAEDAPTFTSEQFGLKISAPVTWKFVPSDFPTEEYAVHKDLLGVVKNHRSLPIVRIAKPVAGGNHAISPAVQIFVPPDREHDPKLFLWTQSRTAAAAFEDFHITREPYDTILADTQCAAIESTFITPYSGGRRFATLSRVWALPHQQMMFVISVTGPPEDIKALAGDIDVILKSIKFREK